MRSLLLFASMVAVGCAHRPTPPLSDDMARVTLDTISPTDELSAYRLDGELVDGLQFPDIDPGPHEVRVRFRYEAPGRVSAGGLATEVQRRSCIMAVNFDGFAAGEEYRLVANRLGWTSVGWLESAAGDKLASAEVIRCGPGA
ncbi:MAG TPA: hypothetical protein ENI17_04230 [Pseudomonas xinjiangensis]|uniref:Lipoprotein n=1 Tax=Halopseudomonas xinjiangensis TaxID=487184 RepID=A0A7V1BNI0_9GAMM|nr:hypothetical protein [Halopseudomonas xinjiangensis]HEC46816.1 hypothetical protein [Halopseudomonas xinjiangensis]